MLAKGQVRAVPGNDIRAQRAFVHQVFAWQSDQAGAVQQVARSTPTQQNPHDKHRGTQCAGRRRGTAAMEQISLRSDLDLDPDLDHLPRGDTEVSR